MNDIKTIGVLTSGGDSPGMNAAVRAIVRCGIHYGFKVMGIKKGYTGLLNGEIEELNSRGVSNILQRGGTILQTSRCLDFMKPEVVKKGVEKLSENGIDLLVVIGGDGSFRGAKDLSDFGMPVMCIPGTIDNDIVCTDYTIGYDTALNTAMEAIDKIRDTAYSHERASVVEVMGRHAGHIALNVAIANGAEIVLIPEKNFNMETDVIKPILSGKDRGKQHYVIIVAEGVGNCESIAEAIREKAGVDTIISILGYIQRGGVPTLTDRVMASKMGFHTIKLIKSGVINRVIAFKSGEVTNFEINEAIDMKKCINESDLELSRILAL